MDQNPEMKYTQALREVRDTLSLNAGVRGSTFEWGHRTLGRLDSEMKWGLPRTALGTLHPDGIMPGLEAIYGPPGSGKSVLALALIVEGMRQGQSQVLIDLSGHNSRALDQPDVLGVDPKKVKTLRLGEDLKIEEVPSDLITSIAMETLPAAAHESLCRPWVEQAVNDVAHLDASEMLDALSNLPIFRVKNDAQQNEVWANYAHDSLRAVAHMLSPLIGDVVLPECQAGDLLHITATARQWGQQEERISALALHSLSWALPTSQWNAAPVTFDHCAEDALEQIIRMARSKGMHAVRVTTMVTPFANDDVFSKFGADAWVGPHQFEQANQLVQREMGGPSISSLLPGTFLYAQGRQEGSSKTLLVGLRPSPEVKQTLSVPSL